MNILANIIHVTFIVWVIVASIVALLVYGNMSINHIEKGDNDE
jgi:hypothetical protein